MDTLVVDNALAPMGLRGQFLEIEDSFGGDVYTVHKDGQLVCSRLNQNGQVQSEDFTGNMRMYASVTVGMPYEPVRLTYLLEFAGGKLRSLSEIGRRELYAMI